MRTGETTFSGGQHDQAGGHSSAADLGGFLRQVREVLAGFDDSAAASWEAAGHVPATAVRSLAEAGVFRERWKHGAERGLPHLATYSQELFGYSSGLAISAMGHSEMFIGALAWLAAQAAQRTLLEAALDGAAVGCFAATEAHGGSDLAGIRTSVVRSRDGWHLTGQKRYISNAGGASHVLVLARLLESRTANDLSLFVVQKEAPGVHVDGFFEMVGLQACDVGQITFDVALPEHALLGQPGLGLLYATRLLQFERISICAQLVAAARLALGLAVAYARQRQVGGVRILDKQAVRHRLAYCQARLWNLESRTADLIQRAVQDGRMPGHEIAALKLTAGEDVGWIVDACMQVFGARGSSRVFPLEKLWRDARLARFGGGTDEVLADIVGLHLDRSAAGADTLIQRAIQDDGPVTVVR
jgi:acyl-ACP dehydrogenase